MTYEETIEYLFNSTPVFEKIGAGAYKEGLSNTKALDDYFGHPHRQFRSIHVAGTNGKGSVSHTLAAILQSAGYKVGLYTSPHLVDFRERIRVNGVMIDEQTVIDFVAAHRHFFEPLHPSFFELTTAMAFHYFASQGVDIAIVEVGLGGRLDCTNIITPTLSIITNISIDHTQFLGDTMAKIAAEKAGIIKKGVPVVIGESTDETRPVFSAIASECQSQLIWAEENCQVIRSEVCDDGGRKYATKDFGFLHGQLGGTYQEKNMNTILTAVQELKRQGFHISYDHLANGLAHVCELTGLTGRWQRVSERPLVICDTGHNVGGWQYLSRQITMQPCRTRRIIFGMVDDKDVETVIDMLPRDAVYYFTRPSSKRAFDEKYIAAIGQDHGLKGRSYPTVTEAYHTAMAEAQTDDFIFIGGSSYVVADFLQAIQKAQ